MGFQNSYVLSEIKEKEQLLLLIGDRNFTTEGEAVTRLGTAPPPRNRFSEDHPDIRALGRGECLNFDSLGTLFSDAGRDGTLSFASERSLL